MPLCLFVITNHPMLVNYKEWVIIQLFSSKAVFLLKHQSGNTPRYVISEMLFCTCREGPYLSLSLSIYIYIYTHTNTHTHTHTQTDMHTHTTHTHTFVYIYHNYFYNLLDFIFNNAMDSCWSCLVNLKKSATGKCHLAQWSDKELMI